MAALVLALSLLQTVALRVDTTTVDAENRSRGVPNYLHQVVISPDGLRLRLAEPVRAITPGQSGALYDEGGRLLGGGVIA